MSLLGDKISVLYQYVMGYLPTASSPLQTEPDRLEKEEEEASEDVSNEKMSDQDLITFGGDEARETGDDAPDTETIAVDETEPESSNSTEVADKMEVGSNVVSTASIDLSVVETSKPKEETSEEVSVEFEQLNLSPEIRRETDAPIIEARREAEVKEKKGSKRPPNNHAAESKIAMEIREMRKREEELRQMREQAASRSKPQETVNESIQSDGSTKSEDFLEDDGGSTNNVNFHAKNSMTRAVSLDSLHVGQTYNIGYAFCHRRKDRIKVKPLEDGDDERDSSKYRALKESPIEREIRLAREREEELKREKGLIRNGEVKEKPKKLEEPIKMPESPVTGNDTQRLLATTRIQQEIEEQTRREMALRESGHIQTISQERTDSKVTRIREAGNCTPDGADRKQSPSPTVEIYEKTNGHALNGKSPSPTSSSSSANNIPVGRKVGNPPPPGRGISMRRFIKSKGKDIGFTAFSGGNYYNESPNSDYYEIRPPQVRKINGHMASMVSRRSTTAESKIQEELKEMKAREDELRRQRARLLGLSQPNLSSLVSDEDLLVTNGDSEETHLDRSNSNPNLLDENDNHDSVVSNVRRKSALIAQWEQRIQKAEAKS
ncbi:uncharacterized protein LOC111629116 isoform X2 [Centruroides sculpturatus]|uniref:uncharacterized protein LOC111629116 isoform X2 n=1 Tax=Centruroides sculpturatus TaxID=218467 RepID=UPI000C6D54CC|nr:uncharacterized protein LOC111629116 isoform X2 [Centruroides sculpturatus]